MDWEVWSGAESVLFTLDKDEEVIMADALGGQHLGRDVAVWVGKSFVYGQISSLKLRLASEYVKLVLGEGESAIQVRLGVNEPVRLLSFLGKHVDITQAPAEGTAVSS